MSVIDQMNAWNAGSRGGLYFGNETAAYNAAAQDAWSRSGGAGGGGGGGAGGLLLLFALPLLPFAFVVGLCMFPLAGLLTALVGAAIAGVLDDGRTGGLVMLVAMLLPCVVVFFAALRLERRLERRALYRKARHVVRVLATGFAAHAVAFSFAGPFPRSMPFLDRLSIAHVAAVVVAMVVAHVAFRRYDRRIDAGDASPSRWLRLRSLPWPFRRRPATPTV